MKKSVNPKTKALLVTGSHGFPGMDQVWNLFSDASLIFICFFLLCICACKSPSAEADQSIYEPKMEWIDGELYYQDETGEIDKTEAWRKVNERWYYIGPKGYAVRNRWKGVYYLLDNGEMAVNRFIDRFYVNENGAWEYNNWDLDHWLVNGKWIHNSGEWFFEGNDGTYQLMNLKDVRSINRLGYNTLDEEGMPQQSIAAYQAAIDHGFRILLCDLRFTLDGLPVCFHDSYINQKARNSDGSEIVELGEGESLREDQKIFVAESTLEQLQQYDFGAYRGEEYAGTEILTFEKMLAFCQDHEVAELYIEIKEGTDEQIQRAVQFANESGLTLSWAASTYEQAKAVVAADPCARISLMPDTIDDELLNLILSLKTDSNNVFIFAYGNTILTPELVEKLKSNNIEFEMGTIDSEREILNYWNGAYYYCSGIESNTVIASDIDVGKILAEIAE